MMRVQWLTSQTLNYSEVSPIPTSRIISSHPSALYLGDPTLTVQRQEANPGLNHKDLISPLPLHGLHSLSMDVKRRCPSSMEKLMRRPDIMFQSLPVLGVRSLLSPSHLSVLSKRIFRSNLDRNPTKELSFLAGDLIFLANCKKQDQCGYFYYRAEYVAAARVVGQDKQLANVPVPLDHFPVNALTSKVFSFMVKKGKHFSGKVTPLFASMLVQPTEDEGAPSERPSEAQPTPSPIYTSKLPVVPQTDPSPTHTKSSGGNLGGHSSSDKSLSGNEGEMTLQSVYDLCISLCTQSMDEECLLEAKISKKEILKETMDAQRVLDEEKRMQKMYLSTAQHKLPSDDNAREGTKEWEDEEERNRLAEEEATNNALIRNYNDIKARIKADRLLAEKLQEEEREQFIIKKSNILHDTICSSRNIPGFNKDLKLSGTNHLQKNQTEKSNG
ncbi:hypothetical protein Tco_0795979 [Tanacetum coccineum]